MKANFIKIIIFNIILTLIPNISHSQDNKSLRDSLDYYKMEIENIKSELNQLKSKTLELEISKNYFDIIISSQWNTFSTIISVIVGALAIFAGIKIYKDIKISFKDIPELKKNQQQLMNDIQSLRNDLKEIKFNANRAFFLGHLNRNNFDWATIASLRSMEYSIQNRDVNGILSWLNEAKESFEKANEMQRKRIKRDFYDEINQQINNALDLQGIDENTDFYLKLKEFKQLIYS